MSTSDFHVDHDLVVHMRFEQILRHVDHDLVARFLVITSFSLGFGGDLAEDRRRNWRRIAGGDQRAALPAGRTCAPDRRTSLCRRRPSGLASSSSRVKVIHRPSGRFDFASSSRLFIKVIHHHIFTLGFQFAVVELMADRSSNSTEELMEDEEFSSADGDRSTYGDNDSVS